MAAGQTPLVAPSEQVNVTTPPNAPVETIPSDQSTALVQPTAADVLAGIQAAAASGAPVSQVPSQPLTATIPPEADLHSHMDWMHRVLNTVGSIMGGDTTLRVTKDAAGNVSVTRDPSTLGEKWGRVAQAALGGAAQGLANAQGPGGLARAGAAGTQFGLQLPQQREQAANQEATQQQQILMRNAQKAYLQQQIVQNAFNMKQQGVRLTQEQSDRANQVQDWLLSNPNNQQLGDFANMQEVAEYESAHHDLISGHTTGAFHTEALPDGKVRLFRLEPGWLDQQNDEPITYGRLKAGTTIGATPTIEQVTIPPRSGNTRRQISTAMEAETKRILDYQIATAKIDKGPSDEWSVSKETPGYMMNKRTGELRQLPAGVAPAEEGGGFTASTPEETEQLLGTLSPGDAATVRAIGEIRQAPPSRYSKEGMRIMELVNRAYPDYDQTRFPLYQRTKLDFSPAGTSGKGLNFIGTALNHIDRMEGNVDALHNVSTPIVGPWWNAVSNAAMSGTSPAIKRFMDDQKAVTAEVARAYNGGALTNSERDEMMSLINTSDSPEAIRSSLGEFRDLLRGKLDSYRQGWEAQMPNHQRNTVLDALTARRTNFRQAPAAAPAATPAAAPPSAAPAQPAPPASINAAPANYQEGSILVNPQTKQRVQLRNNQWVPLP